MELLVQASVFTAGPGSVQVVADVLCALALAASGLVVAGTAAERDSRLIAPGRWLCVAFTALLAAAGFLGLLPRWAFAVACVACLLSLLAVALRCGQGTSLRGYLEAPGGEEEPGWWPAFEHGFRCYTSTPGREPTPLRRAVTRPTSKTADGYGRRVPRRPPDAMTGGRP